MEQKRWQDWVMLAFGVWLIISPFVLQFSSYIGAAAVNSYVLGAAVGIVAIVALAVVPRLWEEWVNLVLGVWLILAPFVLGFHTTELVATWDQVILGILIGADAIWAMAERPVHKTAS